MIQVHRSVPPECYMEHLNDSGTMASDGHAELERTLYLNAYGAHLNADSGACYLQLNHAHT